MIRAIAFVLLPACAATVSVAPGHGAVVTTADGRMTAIGEGVVDVPGDAQVDDFDLRQQNDTLTFTAITADGVPAQAKNAVLTYQATATELVQLDEEVGENYAQILLQPILAHALASVLGTYRWDALTADAQREVQARVQKIAAQDLQPHHVTLVDFELKGLFPDLPLYNKAVDATGVLEQKSATSDSRIAIAKQRADAQREKAKGIVDANNAIGPTLTKGVLEDSANKAWTNLITSPRASVNIATHSPIAVEP